MAQKPQDIKTFAADSAPLYLKRLGKDEQVIAYAVMADPGFEERLENFLAKTITQAIAIFNGVEIESQFPEKVQPVLHTNESLEALNNNFVEAACDETTASHD